LSNKRDFISIGASMQQKVAYWIFISIGASICKKCKYWIFI